MITASAKAGPHERGVAGPPLDGSSTIPARLALFTLWLAAVLRAPLRVPRQLTGRSPERVLFLDSDIELAERNGDPRGIWSNSVTVWVSNRVLGAFR